MREFKQNDIVEVNYATQNAAPKWEKAIFKSLRTDFKSAIIYNCTTLDGKSEFCVFETQIRQVQG